MLYLLPNLLCDDTEITEWLPKNVQEIVPALTHLIAESEKPGRLFLRKLRPDTFREVTLVLLNEHTHDRDKKELLSELKKGGTWGLVSDCGMPCLADPGADFVLMAKEAGVSVKAFPGPCSPMLALVLSGLGGQKFTFHGYLAKKEDELIRQIQRIEAVSKKEKSIQLFIETPYRNERMLRLLLQTLSKETYVTIACDLTADSEQVMTHRVGRWLQLESPDIHKKPAVFLIRSY